MLREMKMAEMMKIDGGHYSKNTDSPKSNEYANRFARDVVIILSVGAGALTCGASAGAAAATTALAAGGDRLLNEIE